MQTKRSRSAAAVSAPRRSSLSPRTAGSGATRKPAPKRCSVTFSLFAPDAQRVDVSGSFNGWELKPLKRGKTGTWKANLRPKPGRYEYKFLVDHQWVTDPSNSNSITDPNGNVNSVIDVA